MTQNHTPTDVDVEITDDQFDLLLRRTVVLTPSFQEMLGLGKPPAVVNIGVFSQLDDISVLEDVRDGVTYAMFSMMAALDELREERFEILMSLRAPQTQRKVHLATYADKFDDIVQSALSKTVLRSWLAQIANGYEGMSMVDQYVMAYQANQLCQSGVIEAPLLGSALTAIRPRIAEPFDPQQHADEVGRLLLHASVVVDGLHQPEKTDWDSVYDAAEALLDEMDEDKTIP